jgi:hypothetical protein
MGEPAVETLETLETSLETPQDTVDTNEVVEAAPAPARASEDATEDAATEPAPKKKGGRPAGAKSKAQGKPRPKRVAANKMRARALEEAPPPPAEEEVAQLPRALPGSRPIPLESENFNPRDRTTLMMMTMLREQAADRRQRKADLWKSWFR